MANNYLLFSEELSGLTEEEKNWLEQELKQPDWEDEDWSEERIRSWCNERDVEEIELWPEFMYDVQKNDESHWSIWFYSDESANLESLISLIVRFFKHFNRDEYFTLSWAHTCSKPRLGEFGGGAVIANKSGATWINTDSWLHEQILLLKRKT